MHAGCVFVTGIHLSRTWMSGSFESVVWNACVHRLDLSLDSHPKKFLGNGVRTHVNSKGKIPSTGGSEEGHTRDAALRTTSPTHYTDWATPVPEMLMNWMKFIKKTNEQRNKQKNKSKETNKQKSMIMDIIIPVWMTFIFIQGHIVVGNLESKPFAI